MASKFSISSLDQLQLGDGEGQVSSFAISDFFISEHEGTTYSISPYDLAEDVLSSHLSFKTGRRSGRGHNVLSALYTYVDNEGNLASSFITSVLLQDGTLSNVEFDETSSILSLQFNSIQPSASTITVDLKSLVDVYQAETPLCADANGHSFGIDISALSVELESLISFVPKMQSEDLIYYVSNDGDDIDGDGSKDHPFNTIQKAVDESNNLNFTGDAHCIIRLLSNLDMEQVDIEDGFIQPKQTKIYHPDMVQERSFIIEGYDGDHDYRVIRKIEINQSTDYDGETYIRKPYSVAIDCEANVTFIGIYFYGNYYYLTADQTSIDTISYLIRAGNNVMCEFNTCYFEECHTAIMTGSCSVVNVRKCAFNIICRGIDSLNNSSVEISHDTTVYNIKIFALTSNKGSIRVNFNYPSFFLIATNDYPFSINDSGNLLLTLNNNNDNDQLSDYAFLIRTYPFRWIEFTGNLQQYLSSLTNDSTRTNVGYNQNGYMNIYTTDSAFLSNMTSNYKYQFFTQHNTVANIEHYMLNNLPIEDLIV